MQDLSAFIRAALADGSRRVRLPNGTYSVPAPLAARHATAADAFFVDAAGDLKNL